jgi:hypothetical protein
VPDISEIIQAIARQRGRGEAGPLILLRQLDGTPGERISHLPIDSSLAQAWVALRSEPFRPHQAQALTALRRGEPVALAAASADVAMSAYLLLYATLLAEPHSAALLLAPDMAGAHAIRGDLDDLNGALPQSLRLAPTLIAAERRPDHYARIVVATPEALHSRLLRHHDRAWALFWPRLRLIALPEAQRYAGVAGAHLANLLLRVQRIAAAHAGDQLRSVLATIAPCEAPGPALNALLGQAWRVIAADDGPDDGTWLAVWRGASRLREAAELANQVRRQGYHVHILCEQLESPLLAPLVGDHEGVSCGPVAPPAHVLIAAGYTGPISAVRRQLRSGYQAVIVVLGDAPHEQAIARQTELLLSAPPAAWPASSANAYAAAQHVLCAASELPLTEAEVEVWGAQDIVARLSAQGQLVDLPDEEVAWKPTDSAGDPYAEFSTLASSGSAIVARSDQGLQLAALDPTGFERWTFPNAALPPGAGGFRVAARDEEHGTLTLRLESNGRRSFPLRRCEVAVREEREARPLAGGRRIGWGRVVVDEQIYGYREASANAAPSDLALQPPLVARWAAPACWFDVGIGVQVLGQFVGWSLAAALQLRAFARMTDVVPCYDHAARRLFLVDAQPGGNGLAAWIYSNAEQLLPLAYDVALACRNDALLEPLSRADMDWLLALLGRAPEAAPAERPRVSTTARAAPLELIEGPPPTTPRLVLTPAPPEERRPTSDERRETRDDRRPRNEERGTTDGRRQTSEERHETRDARRARDDDRQQTDQVPGRAEAAETRQRPQAPETRHPPSETRQHPSRPQPPAPERRQRELPFGGEPPRPERSAPRQSERAPEPPAAPRPARTPPQPERTATNPAPGERSASQQPERAASQQPQRPAQRPPAPARQAPNNASPPPDDAPPDADALIARLRRQRAQREAQQGAAERLPQSKVREPSEVEQRFAAGDRIFCLPYGDGVVQESRVEDDREMLTVNFMNHGDLQIDPAVNFVRKVEEAPEEDDLL